MPPFQVIAIVRHDAVKPILQRHVAYTTRQRYRVLRQIQVFLEKHTVHALYPLSIQPSAWVESHADHLDHQDLRTNGDECPTRAFLIKALTMWRLAGDWHDFGRKISSDVVFHFPLIPRHIRHWKLQAGFDSATCVNLAAVITGPLLLERHSEQPIDGYVPDKVSTVEKSALCGNQHANWQAAWVFTSLQGKGNLLETSNLVVVNMLEHGGQASKELMGVVHPGRVQKRVLGVLDVAWIASGMQHHGPLEGH
jgi:hypothetical protein